MYVRVSIDAQKKNNILVIPQLATAEDITGYYVMVVDKKNIVRRQKVVLGIRKNKEVEVVSGLKNGEKVIVAGLQHVRPEMLVKIDSTKKDKVVNNVK